MMESTVTAWKEFLTRYYKHKIIESAVSDDPCILIKHTDILNYDYKLSEQIINEPDKCLAQMQDALALMEFPFKNKINKTLRVVGFKKHVRIRDIRSDNVNRLSSVECTVQNISHVCDSCVEAAFECARCKKVTFLCQEGAIDGVFIEPAYCECNDEKKGVFRLLYKESKFTPFQKIRLQENPEDLSGDEQPRVIDACMFGDLTDDVKPGERIVLNGILRSQQRQKNQRKTKYFDYYFDAVSVEHEEIAYEDLKITHEDETRIRSYAESENPADLVASCIAPWIFGNAIIKLGMSAQLFGGVRKVLPSGKKIRGDIHILWVGDPGMAKSEMLIDIAENLAPRGIFCSGLGISGAGLTAATVKDDFTGDGAFSLRAGVLALMNGGGIACIDEVGRMKDEDREKMHPAMEQQIIPIDRAGFHTTLRSECSVLAAGNPKDSRWDDGPVADQIGIDKALITRFDLIFVSRDVPNPERDREIANHVLTTNKMGEEYARLRNKGQSIPAETEGTLKTKIPRDDLKKWIAFARRKIFPVINDDVKRLLSDFYVEIRNSNGSEKILHATPRQLEGPIRLAEAFARIRLSDTVTQEDAMHAIAVIKKSMVDSGNDYDLLNVGNCEDQRERRKRIVGIIESLEKEHGCAILEDAIYRAEKVGITGIQLTKELKYMIEFSGEIYETGKGNYRVSRDN